MVRCGELRSGLARLNELRYGLANKYERTGLIAFETGIEKTLRHELEKRGYRTGIDFAIQYPLRYGYIIDIAFPQQNIAIEADGAHWHNKPGMQQRDKVKNAMLKKMGWIVVRFSEEEIKKDAKGCINRIESELSAYRNVP